ncbi:MAG: terminase small subunit [Pseudomonadota bacterium]
MQKLTHKQKRFVEEYVVDLNATQAAVRAGYSEKTARQIASEMLSKPYIQDAIAKGQEALSKRTGVTAEMVIQELARIGFSDLRKVVSSEGNLLDPHDWDDDTAAAIASIEVVTTRKSDQDKSGEEKRQVDHTHKIKVWDKNAALEKLGKHLNLFAEQHEVLVADNIADLLDARRRRALTQR